ncbi:MAG TPA: hypothetical protein VH815_04795 [Acidobacteriota bacterium]
MAVATQIFGQVYFDMEKVDRPSRWNTLRALRILKWRNTGVQK